MKHIFQLVLAVNRYLLSIEKVVLCALLFSMVALSFGQVVARNLFQTGFVWIMEIIRVEVLWITLIGGALAMEYRQYIKIDFLFNIVESGAMIKVIDTLSQVFSMFICFLLFVVAKEYITLVSTDTTSTVIHGVPDWAFQLVIPYCFGVMSLRCLICIVKIIQGLDTRESEYRDSFDELAEESKQTS